MFARELDELALGSRLRALSDRLFDGVDAVYRAHGVSLQSRWFLLLRCLHDHGPQTVSGLADRLGQSHPAVSQLSKKLIDQGWIERRGDQRDLRRSVLALTSQADRELAALAPLWGSIIEAMRECIGASGHALMDAIGAFEAELDRQPVAQRIERSHVRRRQAEVTIVPFSSALREHFYRLNAEWLTRYYSIEAIDHRVLSQPEEHILRPGGVILFALLDGQPIGTGALLPDADGRYELTKMAVTSNCQGLGVGRRLLQALINEFHRLGGTELFLESQEKLQSALHLYESLGFVRQPGCRPDSHYARADVYMIYAGQGPSAV